MHLLGCSWFLTLVHFCLVAFHSGPACGNRNRKATLKNPNFFRDKKKKKKKKKKKTFSSWVEVYFFLNDWSTNPLQTPENPFVFAFFQNSQTQMQPCRQKLDSLPNLEKYKKFPRPKKKRKKKCFFLGLKFIFFLSDWSTNPLQTAIKDHFSDPLQDPKKTYFRMTTVLGPMQY